MKRLILITGIFLSIFLAACGGSPNTPAVSTPESSNVMTGTPVSVGTSGTYWTITPSQLYSFPVKDFTLADTDTSYIGEIGGTDLFLNSAKIGENLDKFPADKNSKIVVYCTAGVNSKAVAETLVKAGYTRVMDLAGGILAWKQKGYATLMKTRTMA